MLCVCVCVCVWGGGGLVNQYAVRMRLIILSYVASLAVQHFQHYLIKGAILHEDC